MISGIKFEPGDVVLANVQFTDTFEIKRRPVLVLYEEYNNVVVAGITSNLAMEGIPLTVEDGVDRESIIKLNYVFTISQSMIERKLFRLNPKKRHIVYKEISKRLEMLIK